WLQLAQVLVRQGLTEDAVHAYQEVIKRNPKDAGSLIGAAAGLLRLGRIDEARRHAELALSVTPAAAHELLAKVALARHDRWAAPARPSARSTSCCGCRPPPRDEASPCSCGRCSVSRRRRLRFDGGRGHNGRGARSEVRG